MVCRLRVQPSLLGEGAPDTRERRKSSLQEEGTGVGLEASNEHIIWIPLLLIILPLITGYLKRPMTGLLAT